MRIIEKYITDIITGYPILTLISFLAIVGFLLNKFINLLVDVKMEIREYRNETEQSICNLEDKVENYHEVTTDKFHLISDKIGDKFSNSVGNLVDRISENNKLLSNILIMIENRN